MPLKHYCTSRNGAFQITTDNTMTIIWKQMYVWVSEVDRLISTEIFYILQVLLNLNFYKNRQRKQGTSWI